jgi:putative addiction module component (TIGR02574 family)
MQFKALKAEALRLSLKERAELAAELLKSLDEDPGGGDFEEAWIEEAERCYAAYKAGKTKAIPAEQVFREMRAQFKHNDSPKMK